MTRKRAPLPVLDLPIIIPGITVTVEMVIIGGIVVILILAVAAAILTHIVAVVILIRVVAIPVPDRGAGRIPHPIVAQRTRCST